MKAFVRNSYGGPEVLKLTEVDKPSVKKGNILVKIYANSANAADWHILRGKPFLSRFAFGLFRPKEKVLGVDFSGVVEGVGEGVTTFKIGDRVFGESLKGRAFAEYLCVAADACSVMPDNRDFSEMACVPVAGLTAFQALITHGKLKSGESILINGASGGVGHFSVQIAKAYGAVITAVCSSGSSDFVKGLGADHVIAYDQENIHSHAGRYDLVVDTHGNLKHDDYTRMGRRGVMVGFTTMGNMMFVLIRNIFSKFQIKQFTAKATTNDLTALADLIREGKVRTSVEKTYPYGEIPEAIRYTEAMHTKGKVAMVWESE